MLPSKRYFAVGKESVLTNPIEQLNNTLRDAHLGVKSIQRKSCAGLESFDALGARKHSAVKALDFIGNCFVARQSRATKQFQISNTLQHFSSASGTGSLMRTAPSAALIKLRLGSTEVQSVVFPIEFITVEGL